MNEIPVDIAATINHSAEAKVKLLSGLIPLYEAQAKEESREKLDRWRDELAENQAVLDWLHNQVWV